MSPPPLPLTYDECRARFRRSAGSSGFVVRADPIDATGPEGQQLTIDSVRLGPARPERALLVLGGVHGVEGFIVSALQCDLLERLDPRRLPDDLAVLVVHGVNPWGMAWWRRENESNVDLNRNWFRDRIDPPVNGAYDELHAVVCPDVDELPPVEQLVETAGELVAARGLEWVRDGITTGQFHHADGLHYGGAHTEASNRVVEDLVADVVGADVGLVLDLHTGHGPHGEVTLLCDDPPGSDQHLYLTSTFAEFGTEATVDNPAASTGLKYGQIANGIRDLAGADCWYATSVEFGTTDDVEMLTAAHQERWVHFHGDRDAPEHAAARWRYRCCFTPDDPDWVDACRSAGAVLITDALAAFGAG